ncbi:MAG: Gfo/Idh/MocA family oxidoreductase [Sedimentisphaerales bacterium]|nr:Gfo/Idh/MocA family oxidoreductase [Sedimentisphaerales bacterium]
MKDCLSTAVLGLNDRGRLLLEAAAHLDCFHIQAVADQDPQRAEKAAAQHACQAYTDYRQLIVQNQFDCLLVAADIHACEDHLKTALKRKSHILKLAPPARNFEETLEYVQMAETAKVQFAIANPARFRSSYITAHELIHQNHIEHIFLVTAFCRADGGGRPAWWSDPKLAGGGVLMHDCYQIVDQILWNFALPQQVYALNSNQAPDKKQRLYLTEDTSVVSMKFTDALVGNVVATRRNEIKPHETTLRLYGRDALLTVTENHVTLQTGTEQDNQEWNYDEEEPLVMQRLLSSFAHSVTTPEECGLIATGAENLANMAVLEAAYLSARTGFPEEPARILRLGRNPSGTATTI